jgi:uncharacterized protein YkwD|tara:strand:+ start:4509 stop:5255 length:747 start_codon:yes stop_codon:yes gene_type:complete
MRRNRHRRYTKRHLNYPQKQNYIFLKVLIGIIIVLLISYNWGSISNSEFFENSKSKIKDFTSSFDMEYKNVSEVNFVQNLIVSAPEREEECINTFNELNSVRVGYGKKQISWDNRAYELAVARSKDMYERNYFDHVTPEGTCVKDFKIDYGFNSYEVLAENAGGMSYYGKGDVAGNCNEALDGWLESRGHKYNLLYDFHNSGAIGCYYEICIFLGVHQDPYGLGAGPCSTGEEGEAFWSGLQTQPGEV